MTEEDNVTIIERVIGSFNFRYYGGNTIEVRRIGDKQGNVLRVIPIKNNSSSKDVEKEISFWYMENGNSIQYDEY